MAAKRCRTKADHVAAAMAVHGDVFDYSEWLEDTASFDNKSKIPIRCRVHGTFFQILNNHKSGSGCPQCVSTFHKSRSQYISHFTCIHGNRYQYLPWPQTYTTGTRIGIVCAVHGVFNQAIAVHARGSGCPQCKALAATETSRERYGVAHANQRHMPALSLTRLADVEWLTQRHIVDEIPVCEIARELFVDAATVHNRMASHGIPVTQSRRRSFGERQLADFVATLVDVVVGDRQVIAPRELDITIPTHKIAIEYCGMYWHSTANPRMIGYHADKQQSCSAGGWQLITVFEDEWQTDRDRVERHIENAISSRRCIPSQLTVAEAAPLAALSWGVLGEESYGDSHSLVSYTEGVITCVYGSRQAVIDILLTIPCDLTVVCDLKWFSPDMYEAAGFVVSERLPPRAKEISRNQRHEIEDCGHIILTKKGGL